MVTPHRLLYPELTIRAFLELCISNELHKSIEVLIQIFVEVILIAI